MGASEVCVPTPVENLRDPLRETEPELVVPLVRTDSEARAVFAPLCAEHDLVRCLLRAFSLAEASPLPQPRVRQRALGQLQRFVRIHDRAEHTTVYAALLAQPRTRRLAQIAIEEHHALDAALSDLAEAVAAGAEREIGERMGRYRDLLTVHLLREENELFPLAYQVLGAERSLRMVQRFRDVRQAAQRLEE